MTKQFIIPPWILFQKNILPSHIKTQGDYDNFYHRYEGKKNAIKNALGLLFFHLPFTGAFTILAITMLVLPLINITVSTNLAGFIEYIFVMGLCFVLTFVFWNLFIDCVESIIRNYKAYQKYKAEIK